MPNFINESIFENAEYLESFNIDGFGADQLKSASKCFMAVNL